MVGGILVIAPFGKVWAPFIFQNHRQEDDSEMIGRGFTFVSRRFYRFRLETGEMLCFVFGAGVIYGLFEALYQVFPLAWKPLSAGVFLLFPAAVALRWRRRRVFGSPLVRTVV